MIVDKLESYKCFITKKKEDFPSIKLKLNRTYRMCPKCKRNSRCFADVDDSNVYCCSTCGLVFSHNKKNGISFEYKGWCK